MRATFLYPLTIRVIFFLALLHKVYNPGSFMWL